MAMTAEAKSSFPPLRPSKLDTGLSVLNASVGNLVLTKVLAFRAQLDAVDVGLQTGINSPAFNHALERYHHADSVASLASVFKAGQHPGLTGVQAVLSGLVVAGEYAGIPTKTQVPEWKQLLQSVHMVVGTGAASLAPAVIVDMVTRFAGHKEVIASTPEIAIMAYAVFAVTRAGKRIHEYVTYPIKIRKEKIRKHIAESKETWRQSVAPNPEAIESLLTQTKLKNIIPIVESFVRPAFLAVDNIVSEDRRRDRIHRLMTPPRPSLHRWHMEKTSLPPNDTPAFLKNRKG